MGKALSSRKHVRQWLIRFVRQVGILGKTVHLASLWTLPRRNVRHVLRVPMGINMSVSCSAFVAGVCSQCTVCDGGQTEMEACTAVADTVCDAGVVECPSGQFLHGGTGQCEACPACPEDHYMSTSCTASVAGVCTPCT